MNESSERWAVFKFLWEQSGPSGVAVPAVWNAMRIADIAERLILWRAGAPARDAFATEGERVRDPSAIVAAEVVKRARGELALGKGDLHEQRVDNGGVAVTRDGDRSELSHDEVSVAWVAPATVGEGSGAVTVPGPEAPATSDGGAA